MSSQLRIEIPKGVHPDLQEERKTPSFNVEKLADKLNGGPAARRKRKEIEKIVQDEPMFQGVNLKQNNWSRKELYEQSVRRGLKMEELAKRHGWGPEERGIANGVNGGTAFGLQSLMVMPTIERLGTQEQKDKWLPLCRSLKVIGNYGQTELGHGTNLRKLETTATYDPQTEEFVINTPFPSGIKFWPGELGKTTNTSLVMASTISRGKDCGLQIFIVPIRDFETHQPLPGVSVGDIGPKLGGNSNDNGYLMLDHVRVPRENMLMRFSRITPDGRFEQAESQRATYGTMVYVRMLIAGWSQHNAAQAATVAIRYSAVRRQSELEPGDKEPKVLDFQTQQYKLFPVLAFAYATWFVKEDFKKYYNKIYQNEISKGNFQNVAEIHAQSCALKAFLSDVSTADLETCRRACGGHGFLLASGIASKLKAHTPSVTVEGENTVLYLQVARYLLKCYEQAASGKKVHNSMSYLSVYPGQCTIRTADDCGDLGQLVLIFRHMAYKTIQNVVENIQRTMASGEPQYRAWNKHQVQLVHAAKAHAELYVVATSVKHVGRESDDAIRKVLTRLCQLHALYRIHVNSGDFIKTDAMTVDQVQLAEHQMYKLLSIIRPDAVPLVDAFDFHDESLATAIGTYDGHVYERLLLAAQDSELNKADVLPAFHKYIKPFQDKLKANL